MIDCFENRSSSSLDSLNILPGDARHPEYAKFEERIKTFKTWNKASIDAHKLTAAGFIYTGHQDILECFCCAEKLKDLDDTADPWEAHAMVAPHCPHVRRCKGDEYIKKVNNKTESAEETVSKLGYPLVEVIHVAEDKYENAVSTFQAKRLTDETATVEEVLKIVCEIKNEAEGNGDTITSSDEDLEDGDSLMEENRRMKKNITCKICLKAMACIVTIPCGHMASCPQCVPALTTCVICGATIQGTVRAIMAIRI